MEASTREGRIGSPSRLHAVMSSMKTHLGGKDKETIQNLQAEIEALQVRNASLTVELTNLKEQKEWDARDHRDDLARKGRAVATDSANFWTKMDTMKDEVITLTAQEWLKRSRAEDPQLDERCEAETGFKEGILGYMEYDNDLGVRRRVSSWIEDKMPREWTRLYDRLKSDTDTDAKLTWKASISPCTLPHRVYPTLSISLGDKRLTTSGHFIEIPPISLQKYEQVQFTVPKEDLGKEIHGLRRERDNAERERHRIAHSSDDLAHMSAMLQSHLERTKVELSQKILREFLREQKNAGQRHLGGHASNEFTLAEQLSQETTSERFVSRHAENILKNGWWDSWVSTFSKKSDVEPGRPGRKSPYELWRRLSHDVDIKRQLREEGRGTFVRSLGGYKNGEHALEDWIPDSSFLSGL
ncbi:hypothetical protein I302_108738 [Kwoniella bestiolae CBS 10118]|uniref:Uncharacterized protein n=1 Tax=Kwoniella bestiolae CBS 10118 TaxID=1296100 RepID=A0A1B9FTY8_9TREE|nr:hypothetical protein I302_07875 [Kwoniella bestiolae CBS 10118]OCF22230.1 hypothetical protein I302_07875 [Kwoniella bestiolae CBS 10118]